MDVFPAQPIQSGFAQQVPVQPVIPSVQAPIQEPFQKKINLRKILNLGTWIFLVVFLPVTVLIFLSQNTVPGDLFYPVKRGMENVILAAASVSPATRAAFSTDLTEARFKEAQTLVVAKSNVSGLSIFVTEVQAAQLEVSSLTNNADRQKAEEKLLAKINQYQSGLSTLQIKTEENIIAYNPPENVLPTPTPLPVNSIPVVNPPKTDISPMATLSPTSQPISYSTPQSPVITRVQNSPTAQPTLTLIPTNALLPTSTPVKQASSPSSEVSAPTSTPTLISTPTVTQVATTAPPQQGNVWVAEQKTIAETIKEAKMSLKKIKKDLEQKRDENKNENIQKPVRYNEDEKNTREKNTH